MGKLRRQRAVKKRNRKSSGDASIRITTPGRSRTAPITPEVEAALEDQIRKFKAKFGREPGPEDPIFFDPDADTPTPLSIDYIREETVKAMVKAGINPAAIYAYNQTGLLVSEENWDKLAEEDRRAWTDAIAAYDAQVKGPVS